VRAAVTTLCALLLVGIAVESTARPPQGEHVVMQRKGRFGDVFVVDEGDRRSLRFGAADGDEQSALLQSQPGRPALEYVRATLEGVCWAPADRVLVLGLGGGGMARLLRRHRRHVHVDAVDIDPVVVELAHSHFQLRKNDPRLRVVVDDAGAFVDRARAQLQTPQGKNAGYDAIVVDAYGSDEYPLHLGTKSFFQKLRQLVERQKGRVVFNLAVTAPTETRLLNDLRSVFAHCWRQTMPTDGNVVVVASAHKLDLASARAQWARTPNMLRWPPSTEGTPSPGWRPCATESSKAE